MRASILIGLIVFAAANTASAQNPTPQRAGERYKSVRVLTEAPASQMIEMMSVIAGSLGVTCAHCHETDFASDAKPMKDTAREMIRLTATTDAAFGGRGVITCNTCHQGHATPPAVAGVEQAGWMRAPAAAPPAKPLPTADQVFAKYVAAVGGAAAIDKVSSRTVAGTVTRDNGRTGPMSGTFTLTQTLPGSAQMETVFSFPPEAEGELNAEFFRPRRARELAARSTVAGFGVIRSRPTVMVDVAGPSGGIAYRLHFDEADGVLVARESQKPTPVGILAERHELSDYRDVNGIRQPFCIEWMRADYHVTFAITSVR